jgi:hypothetical protein
MRQRGGSAPPLVILGFDTAALLERHSDIAYFAAFNIGSTVRGGARVLRDENALRTVSEYSRGPVAELAVRGRVDIRCACNPTGPRRPICRP